MVLGAQSNAGRTNVSLPPSTKVLQISTTCRDSPRQTRRPPVPVPVCVPWRRVRGLSSSAQRQRMIQALLPPGSTGFSRSFRLSRVRD